MTVNILIDETLVKDAQTLTGLADGSAAVETLLRRILEGRKKNKALLEMIGTVDFRPGYDPKSLR